MHQGGSPEWIGRWRGIVLRRLRLAERQVYIRAGGQVRYVRLSAKHQLAVAAAGFLVLAVLLVSAAGVFVYDRRLDSSRAALGEAMASNRVLLTTLDKSREPAGGDDAGALSDLIEQNREVGEALARTKLRLGGDTAGLAKIRQIEDALARNHGALETVLRTVEGRDGLLKASEPTLDSGGVEGVIEAPAADDERMRLLARIQNLEARTAALHEREKQILERLANSAAIQTKEAERLIRLAGLDVNRILSELSGTGPAGGPFVSLRADMVRGQSAQQRDLDHQIKRWEGLRTAMKQLPVAAPMREFEIASGYGARRDPFNGEAAMHFGLDMTGPASSPILAAASGRVVFSGWKARYGKVVEIDHGIGIKTRYGHLRRIAVRAGESVKGGRVIGEMGSTGRSSGPHLHYEILVQGAPRDPSRFIEAGRNVRKE